MNLRFTPAAKADLVLARKWYRRQSRGLDLEFQQTVEACLARIERVPEGHPAIYRGARRAMLRRFPYGVFYRVEEKAIVVVAVLHSSRDPGAIQRRAR